jgi:SAM-dependent methyltransferase
MTEGSGGGGDTIERTPPRPTTGTSPVEHSADTRTSVSEDLMPDDDPLVAYYQARAPHFDRGYAEPLPDWVAEMTARMQDTLRGRDVLEVACGTGHWTRLAAQTAARITAVDPAPAMREISTAKLAGCDHVQVRDGDAYRLGSIPGVFTGGLAMQWWSHVPRARHDEFLAGWHTRLGPGAAVFLADNQLTPPWEEVLIRRGEDTYEPRVLPDGSEHVIIKNYFTEADLRARFGRYATDLAITMGTRWWWLSYTVRRS